MRISSQGESATRDAHLTPWRIHFKTRIASHGGVADQDAHLIPGRDRQMTAVSSHGSGEPESLDVFDARCRLKGALRSSPTFRFPDLSDARDRPNLTDKADFVLTL